MKILIVTPLYPPDIAEPAPYVKELGKRICGRNEVTILTYNFIPEEIAQVDIVTIPKYARLPVRLIRFTYTLWKEARKADCVYVQNGPSTELPFIIVSYFMKAYSIVRLGDETSLKQALVHPYRKKLLQRALTRADSIITHSDTSPASSALLKHISHHSIFDMPRPAVRPEILPFTPYPSAAFLQYEESWEAHTAHLEEIFKNHAYTT